MTTSPFVIVPTAADLKILINRANSARAEHRQVIRARIILAAAAGHTNTAIAVDVGVHVDTVRKWRRRYAADGLAGLTDLPRSGRPVVFTPVQVAQVKALACTPPADSEVPLARWSTAELALEAVAQGVITSISPSTIGRWLGQGCNQTVAAPVLDLPPRSTLRCQGQRRAGPVRPPLARHPPG